MNLQNPRPLHGNSLVLELNQALPFPIHQLHEPGLVVPCFPKDLPQRRAPQRALVGGEEAAFFVQRDGTRGQLEGDVGGGGEAELLGRVVGGGAHGRLVAVVVGAVDGHVGGGFGVPVDGVEEGQVIGVEDGPVAAFVVDVEGSEGGLAKDHCCLWVSFRILFYFYLVWCGVWLLAWICKWFLVAMVVHVVFAEVDRFINFYMMMVKYSLYALADGDGDDDDDDDDDDVGDLRK